MSHFNTIHGYIHTPSKEEEFNQQVLTSFPFDEQWPLPNIFCLPEHQGRPAMICFAMAWHGSAYAETSAWDEWLGRFEELLSRLRVNEAEVEWQQEIFGSIRVYYTCEASWDQEGYQRLGENRWERVTRRNHADQAADQVSEKIVF